jgi:ATP-dependent DNA helicase RecG
MGLPINIDELIHGHTVEWERLEFKGGWNPEDVIHTICAFANDIHNWGGGYIIIGIDEDKGQPILPPGGLKQNQIDTIQAKITNLAHRLHPIYFPISKPYVLEEKHILVLWCPAGDNRPYNAPTTLGKKAQWHCYIRVNSQTIIAKDDNLRRLQELAARIPFDDRVNNLAIIDDLDLGIIQAYLQEIRSDLYKSSTAIPFEDLCRTMLIAKGSNEDLRPVNVGLMFFTKAPELFFPRAWIELVWHQDGSGTKFKEYYFKGPIHYQLRDALSFLKNNIIGEQVIKRPDKAEADRFYNFPYDAVEEALSNAVYHKSYELGSPIEIQVWPDKIEVLSHPGPVPPVNATILSTYKRIIAREYRNRRIGDFLKELHLTEGRGTGFPTIYAAMEANGSPDPVFETDEQTYVLVTLPVHPPASDQVNDQDKDQVFNDIGDVIAFCNQASDQVDDQASDQARIIVNDSVHYRVSDVLQATTNWIKRADLFPEIGLSNHSTNREKYLDPLINLGWIEMEYPNKKTSPKQRYKITVSGQNLLNLIKTE